jgi:hypothetical protein
LPRRHPVSREIDDLLDFTEIKMKKLMIAVVATIALPAAVFAQAAAAPSAAARAAHAGHDTKAMNCKDTQAMMSGSHSGHSKMDHSKMDHSKMAGCGDMAKAGAQQAPANSHANHQQ